MRDSVDAASTIRRPASQRLLRTAALLDWFHKVRVETMQLVAPLSVEDCCVQAMPEASPAKWHLAHTTWFFETFILERFEARFRAYHPAFRMLFNSYYNDVGNRHARAQRGVLTRPPYAEVLAYRANVDERMTVLLRQPCTASATADDAAIAELVGLGLQHEQQHQELIVTDLKYLLSMNPLQPAYDQHVSSGRPGPAPLVWIGFDSGLVTIGHQGPDFSFDNELPPHRQFVESFALASRLVTNGEFLKFIEANGYQNPGLWLSEGWDWVCANSLRQPLYWHSAPDSGIWREFTLQGLQDLNFDAAVAHVSLYEADAYARWACARLPTETEWECAARAAVMPMSGSVSASGPRCAVTSADGTEGFSPHRIAQLFDTSWQWTSSSYAPYPGYRTAPGALGEYNGKFMVNQYVLRGGSCATPAGHTRSTYRNFFPASARWQFSGIRLARSTSDQA